MHDKAYYKVNFRRTPHGAMVWAPSRIKLDTLLSSSIFPTQEQLRQFERSPAFLDMIYQVRPRG